MFSLQIILIFIFLNTSIASIFKDQGVGFQKDAETKQLKKDQPLSFFNTCTDTAGTKRRNGEEWVGVIFYLGWLHLFRFFKKLRLM